MTLPAAHRDLARDPVLHLLLDAGPLPDLISAPDPFASLIRSVTGQQLSLKAAAAINGRLSAATGAFGVEALLTASPQSLRDLGLSWAKVRTVQAIAAAASTEQINFTELAALSDEAVIQALLPLPGIGRWTAEMFLMFGLGRPDVFSFGDLALRKALDLHYPGQDHASLVLGWQPHRSAAARLLWRSFQVTPAVAAANGARP